MNNRSVMILAAGKGERMGNLTKNTPKPLLDFHGKKLIEWHLEKLEFLNIKDVIINLSYLGNQIKDFVGNGKKWNLNVTYSEENPVLETAGGIKNALNFIKSDPFIVINADIFTSYDFRSLLSYELPSDKNACLFFVNNPSHNLKGDFSINPKGLVKKTKTDSSKTFSGIGIYRKSFFDQVPKNSFYKLSVLLKDQINKENICGEIIKDLWLDIGTPERLMSPIK